MVSIKTPTRTIYLDPARVAAVDVSLPRRDSRAEGFWSSRVDIYVEGGCISLWIHGSADSVIQKAQEIVELIFPTHGAQVPSVVVD